MLSDYVTSGFSAVRLRAILGTSSVFLHLSNMFSSIFKVVLSYINSIVSAKLNTWGESINDWKLELETRTG